MNRSIKGRLLITLLSRIALVAIALWETAYGQNPGYRLYGINFGPYIGQAQDPNINPQISADQISAEMQVINNHTTWVRSYGITNGLENIPPTARKLGLHVAAEAWLGFNPDGSQANQNAAEIDSLVAAVNANQVDVAIVGSEVLFRALQDPSFQQIKTTLLNTIASVKQRTNNKVPVRLLRPSISSWIIQT